VVTGFLDDSGKARGRPVGVVFDQRGALLIADDVGNTVWKVSGVNALPQTATAPVAPSTTTGTATTGAGTGGTMAASPSAPGAPTGLMPPGQSSEGDVK
jgi:hypothetical protein